MVLVALWRALAVGLVVGFAVVCTGCSNTVALQPALDANNPDCANVTVRLPDRVEGQDRRWTDAQATGAWGNPVTIILTCGVEVPGPSTLPCFYLGGTDWIALPQQEGIQRVVTFGRDPLLKWRSPVLGASNFASVLEGLGDLVDSALPAASAECTERTDVRE